MFEGYDASVRCNLEQKLCYDYNTSAVPFEFSDEGPTQLTLRDVVATAVLQQQAGEVRAGAGAAAGVGGRLRGRMRAVA